METIIKTQNYKGFVINTVQQESGRKTYDVIKPNVGTIAIEESMRVAKAVVDCEIN